MALDIDGTLVGHDFHLSERLVAAVRGAVDAGVRVSLATGRMPESAVVYANRLGLHEPIVAHQGAMITAMPARREAAPDQPTLGHRGRTGRTLHHEALAPDLAREAIRWCRDHGLDVHVHDRDHMVVWRGDPTFEDYSSWLGDDAELVDDLEAAITHPITKVIAVGEPPLPHRLYRQALEDFRGRCDPTLSHPRFLEFVAPGTSKGKAVAWLAHRSGVPMGQVMAIGDAHNDLEMIVDAGHGAAMASAPPDVRLAARYVAAPVEEDGAAALIEQLVLAPPDEAEANMRRLVEESAAIRATLLAAVDDDPDPDPDPDHEH